MRVGPRTARRRPNVVLVIVVTALIVAAIGVTNPVAAMSAVATGFFNIAGGGGSVISFLAVTAVGVPALTAHATGQFVTPASFLSGLGGILQHWPGAGLLVTGCLGTVVGVVILDRTPPATVQRLAPYALLLAGLLVVFQGPVHQGIQRVGWTLGPKATAAVMAGVGVYAGIIGVGTGTLALVVLGLTTRYATADLQRLILSRNVLLLGMAVCVALALVPTGLVDWPLALALAVPGTVGGWVGIKLIHRLPVTVLRASIAITAGAGAVLMWLA